jgi:hypothetical protein
MAAKKIGRNIFIAALALVCAAPLVARAEDAPKVTVVVTPNPVRESESLQLRIEVEASQSVAVFQPTFTAPDFIQIGSQPNYGGVSLRQYVNGQMTLSQKTYYEYVLSPKKAGNFVIRDIAVKVGDKTVRSNDMNVKVLPDDGSAPRQQPPRPQMPPGFPPMPSFPGMPNLFDDEEDDSTNPAAPGYQGGGGSTFTAPDDEPKSFNSDFTVFASVSKRKAYVGEPVVIEYYLYDFGGLRQVEVQKWPSFNGFWKEDLEITSRFEFDEVYAGGRPARRAFLSRYALYGIRPGKIALDKLVIRGQYVSGVSNRGFFQTQQIRTGIHGNQDISLEILPLPTEGRPEKFSGAVGQFHLKLEADKTTVAQHTPVTFTATLEGTGNFQAVDNIRIPLPPDFEVYESKTGARDSAPIGMRRELHSQKTFNVVALPRKAGKFTVDSLSWSYFDPESGTYKKLSTNPIEITVTENEAGAQGSNSYLTQNPGGQGSPAPVPEEIRGLKTIGGKSLPLRAGLNIALLLLAILTGWLTFRLLRARAEKYMGGVFQDRFAQAREDYARAKIAKDASWLTSLEDSIFALGEVLLGSNPRGLTRADLEAQWREARLPAPLYNRIALVLDRLDLNRFSSTKTMDSTQRAKLLQEVESILKDAAKVKKK